VTHSRPSARRQHRARRPAQAAAGPGPERAARRPDGQARAGGWPGGVTYWAVLGGIGLGLLWMRGGQADVRGGTLVMAGVLLAGAAARLGLPERRAGMLGSRRRLADAAALAALGAGLLVAGLVFPGSA
jgi:Protein of unknown function (DUF3017)